MIPSFLAWVTEDPDNKIGAGECCWPEWWKKNLSQCFKCNNVFERWNGERRNDSSPFSMFHKEKFPLTSSALGPHPLLLTMDIG